jgi:hypothetical protein
MSAFSSSPPSAVVAVAPRVPSFDPSTGESAAPPSTMSDAPAGRSSWWRGLLTATFPPPRDAVSADDRVLRKRIGSIAAGVAAALVIVALVAGLRPAPSGEAAVAATVVASRAAVALGLLAFAYALLRAAERLFFPPADTQATDSQEPGRSRGEPTKPGTPPH